MNTPETPLESWKEIGAYLQRDATTARRWEKEEGLPVHRHSHKSRSSVYAYPSEIDAWRRNRRIAVEVPPVFTWRRPLALGITTLLCLMMVGNGFRPTVASAQSGQIARQIPTTSFKGDIDSVSADGKYFAGTDWSTGDVAIHDIAAGTSRRITHDGVPGISQYSEESVISPDGRFVAYNWESEETKQTELRIISLSPGAHPQTVYQNPQTDYIEPVAWSPDGKRLLVIRTLKDLTDQVGFVSIQDGSIQVLKSFGWSYPDVSLSPDGRFIAYAAGAGTDTKTDRVFILNADGGQETPLESKSLNSRAPVWSSDGSNILFLSERTGASSLWSVPVAGGKPSGPAALLKANVGSMSPIGITNAGVLYYSLTNDRGNLYLAELDARIKTAGQPALASERFLNSNNRGSWSHDGKYLAYYSFRGSEPEYARPATLVIRTAATGEERDVETHLKVPIHPFAAPPRWFPDNRSVLVVAQRPQQAGTGYYRVDLASGKAELLQHTTTHGIPGFEPDLSSDGKSIFYVYNESGPSELIRFDIDSRKETKLHVAQEPIVSPAVSPDGAQVAYLRNGSIELIPVAGGEPRVVYRSERAATSQSTITWMPDGRNLLFVESSGFGEKDRHVLWRVPLDGSKPEEVGIRRSGGYPFTVQVRPDGHEIAFSSHEGAGEPEIWALENFLPKNHGTN